LEALGAREAAGIVNELVVHPRNDREILLAFLEEVSNIYSGATITAKEIGIDLMVAAATARDEMLGLNP
jgi:chemotaxis protein CheY-P-specific phosphatase CheC